MRERFSTFLSITSTDWPRALSIDRQFQISSRISGASPSVASSRISRRGLVINARRTADAGDRPRKQRVNLLDGPWIRVALTIAGRGDQILAHGEIGKYLTPFRNQANSQLR